MLAEGLIAIGLPCSVLLIGPSVGSVLAGGGRWQVVAGAGLASLAGLWWRAVGNAAVIGTSGRVLGLLVVLTAIAQWRTGRLPVALAAIAGLAGALWWQPCVGRGLGEVLARGPLEPWAIGPQVVAYGVGVLFPLPAIALAVRALDVSERRTPVRIGLGIAGLFGALAMIGATHALAGLLARVTVDISSRRLQS